MANTSDMFLGLISSIEAEKMRDKAWRSLIQAPEEWVERNWTDAMNAHRFYKADPL